MTQRTTASNWALTIVQALQLGGVDCAQVFAELGLNYAALNNPDARFAQDDMTRIWTRAVELSGNPSIALNMAHVVRPASFHVVGYALMSSRNLRDGFARLVRYQRIIGEGADVGFSAQPDGYELSLVIHGDCLPAAPQSMEASLIYCLAFCRWLSGRPLVPQAVCLQGPAPRDLAPYEQLFQAPLRFNSAHYALHFSRADLDEPLPSADEALAQLHDRFAGEYLARFCGSRVTHQVRQVLCRLLPQGEPRRERVAQALHVSARTLQRRLQEEGISYQQLLDETRRELAQQYLAQADLTLLEVGYLLGFADPSNFYRAFRRWHGVTPSEYRLRLSA